MADKATISECFVLLKLNWPDYATKHYASKDESKAFLGLVEDVLGDIPNEILRAATLDCITHCSYWPRISDLRESAAGIMMNQLQIPTSGEAWAEVNTAIHESKPHLHAWSHVFIKQALDAIGGLKAYAMSQEQEQSIWRTHFLKAYEALFAKEQARLRTLPQIRQMGERLESERKVLSLESGQKPGEP